MNSYVTEPAGYSGTPLVKKLGIKPGMRAVAVTAPVHYPDLIEHATVMLVDEVNELSGAYDFIQLFNRTETELQARIKACESHLADGGMIWVSWPKKSSKLWIDLTEDGIRSAVFPLNLVDVKVCAVDADWSGLKVMRRKKPKA